uniref:Uncharacterized protein n=1 Tax=Anguilla anguilla TaxID=7936 RepID=A0A0E9PTQ0_ANGAN
MYLIRGKVKMPAVPCWKMLCKQSQAWLAALSVSLLCRYRPYDCA